MVSGVKGFVMKNSKGAGGEGTDKERAEQARGMSDGDGVDVCDL